MYTSNTEEGYPEDTPQGFAGDPLDYTKGDILRIIDKIKQIWFDRKNIIHNLDALVEFANENDAWDDAVSSSRMPLVYVILLLVSIDTHGARLPAIENMGKFYSFVKERCEDHYRQGTITLYDMCLNVSRDVWEVIDRA